MPKGKGNVLIVVPNDDQPYFMQEVAVADPPGIGPVPVEIELHRGIWIEGKVTDKATGKPVAERPAPLPAVPGEHVRPGTPRIRQGRQRGWVPGSDTRPRPTAPSGWSACRAERSSASTTTAEALPQRRRLRSIKGMNKHGHFETCHNPIWPGKSWPNAMKEINPPEGDGDGHARPAARPRPIGPPRGRRPEGKPVEGAIGRLVRLEWRRQKRRQAPVRADEPRARRGSDRRWSGTKAQKLGKGVRVKEGDDAHGPVVVTLAPLATITGRVVDADGNPVPGATVRPDLQPGGDFTLHLPEVASDRDGRFVVPNVPTGCDYGLAVEGWDHDQGAAARIRRGQRPARRDDRRRRHQVQEGLSGRNASG